MERPDSLEAARLLYLADCGCPTRQQMKLADETLGMDTKIVQQSLRDPSAVCGAQRSQIERPTAPIPQVLAFDCCGSGMKLSRERAMDYFRKCGSRSLSVELLKCLIQAA